jgi:glutaconate CoA-transferase subunit A
MAGPEHRRRISVSLQPYRDKRTALADAVSLVPDGAMVALGGGLSARLPMAMVRELVRCGRRGLHLVGSAHSIDVDMLVAVGAVRRCEESYVGFEQDLGLAPAYRRAAQEGSIEVAESCCATILAQLRAAEMGLPFLPVRGVRGSGIAALHPEYAEITCPFTGETLVAVPALRPDVALLHAPSGDRYGNLHLEQPYVLDERFASASRTVIATVDEIRSPEEVAAAGITIPGHLVAAMAEVPFGAHPSSCYPRYAYDRAHLREYASAAQAGPEDLAKYLAVYVHGTEQTYREAVGAAQLGALAGWSQSTDAWKEIFA